MKLTKRKIEEIAEGLGWNVSWGEQSNGKYATFQQYTDLGQDFSFDAWYERLDDLPKAVYEYWQDFDPSEEASKWLDESGHGKNGAPHDMADVLKDMQQCESMVKELWNGLQGRLKASRISFSDDPAREAADRLTGEDLSSITKEMFSERVADVIGLAMKDKSRTPAMRARFLAELAEGLSKNATLPAISLEGGKGDFAAAKRAIDKAVERCDKEVFDGYAETVRLYADGKKLEPEKLLKLAARALDGLGTAEQMMVSRRLMALGADSERKTALVLEREIIHKGMLIAGTRAGKGVSITVPTDKGGMER